MISAGTRHQERSSAVADYGEGNVGGGWLRYERFTRRQAVGPGGDWEHVFNVMEALAGRFGAEGVRLVRTSTDTASVRFSRAVPGVVIDL